MDQDQTQDFRFMLEYLQFQYEREVEEKEKKERVAGAGRTQRKQVEKKRKPSPLPVWEAIGYCIVEKKDFPEWVREYLGKASNELLKIRNPGNRAADLIKDALGFEDGTTFNYIKAEEKRQIFLRVEEEIRKRGSPDSISEIFAEVARNFERFAPSRGKNRYSDETIKKFYNEMKRIQGECTKEKSA